VKWHNEALAGFENEVMNCCQLFGKWLTFRMRTQLLEWALAPSATGLQATSFSTALVLCYCPASG
jgi:hypothetical protein